MCERIDSINMEQLYLGRSRLCIIGVGLYQSCRTGFIQLCKRGYVLKNKDTA